MISAQPFDKAPKLPKHKVKRITEWVRLSFNDKAKEGAVSDFDTRGNLTTYYEKKSSAKKLTSKFDAYGRILEKTESILVERVPRQTRFYPRNFSEEESKVAKALRKKTPRNIIYILMLNDGEDNNKSGLEFSQIVDNVSKSPSTVSIYLSQLLRDKIVKITLDYNHKKKYRLLNKKLIARLIEDHYPGKLDKSVSGFEDIINSL